MANKSKENETNELRKFYIKGLIVLFIVLSVIGGIAVYQSGKNVNKGIDTVQKLLQSNGR